LNVPKKPLLLLLPPPPLLLQPPLQLRHIKYVIVTQGSRHDFILQMTFLA
jgi:hypothetical protein